MALYWTINSIPELSSLERTTRKRVLRSAIPWARRVLLLVRPVVTGGVVALVTAMVTEIAGIRSALPRVLLVLIMIVAGCTAAVILHLHQVHAIRRGLRRHLQSLPSDDSPICLGCGFDLQGLGTRRCPECGARVDGRP